MLAARNRLRALMGKPTTTTTTTESPTTTDDPMAEARLKVLEKLRKPKVNDPLDELKESRQDDFSSALDPQLDPLISVTSKGSLGEVPSPGNFVPSSKEGRKIDSQLMGSNGLSSPTTRPSITLEPLDPTAPTTFATLDLELPTAAPTRQQVLDLLQSQSPLLPNRMEDTLLRLMGDREEEVGMPTTTEIGEDEEQRLLSLVRSGAGALPQEELPVVSISTISTTLPPPTTTIKPLFGSGRKRPSFASRFKNKSSSKSNKDPLVTRKLTSGHDGFSKPRRTFSDFTPPKRNPLLRKLRGRHRGRYAGLKLPPRKQDILLRTLEAGRNDEVEGLAPPESADVEIITTRPIDTTRRFQPLNNRANPLLSRPLQGGHTASDHPLDVPSLRQNTLLRPLTPGHTASDHELEVPTLKQNTLLRPLTGGQTGSEHSLDVPSLKQNTLLRPLTPGRTAADHVLEVPSLKQNTLLRPLTPGNTAADHILDVPSLKQNTLLNQLRPGHTAADQVLDVPSLKQNTLLNPLTGGQTAADHNLNVPSLKQNTLLRPLTSGHTGAQHVLDTPSLKQDTLLRPLTGGQSASDHNLEVPSLKQNTLLRPLTPGMSASEHLLDPPPQRQDPLLRPLSGDNIVEQPELQVPSQRQNPLLGPLSSSAGDSGSEFGPPTFISEPLSESIGGEVATNAGQNFGIPSKLLNNRDPLITRPLEAKKQSFDPNSLALPNMRLNPLLRILRFDRRQVRKSPMTLFKILFVLHNVHFS